MFTAIINTIMNIVERLQKPGFCIIFGLIIICVLGALLSPSENEKKEQQNKRNDRKGTRYEKKVGRYIRHFIGRSRSSYFTNLIIPLANGHSAELDAVMASKKGIFVIECKHRSASELFGAESSKWANMANPHESVSTANPLYQNKMHQEVLAKSLCNAGLDASHIYSLISTDCKLVLKLWGTQYDGREDFINCLSANNAQAYRFAIMNTENGLPKGFKSWFRSAPDLISDEDLALINTHLATLKVSDEVLLQRKKAIRQS